MSSLDDIRSYPPSSHAGIIVLRLADQSPATVSKAITDLAGLTEATSLGGARGRPTDQNVNGGRALGDHA